MSPRDVESGVFDAPIDVLDGLPLWQATVLVLGVSLGAAVLLEVVILRSARRVVQHTESDFDDILLDELRWPIVVTAGLAGVWLLTQTPSSAEVVAEEQLRQFFGLPSLTVIILVWARALNRVVNRFVNEVKETTSKYDFAPILSNVWTLVVVVGAAFLLLSLWGIDVTPLLGAAGIAGIAIGFAAKDTVANFFGGIALYFDDTYKIGDYILLDSGEAGTVVRVGIRSTTLMTRDEVLVTVPNSVLNAAKIVNQSAPQRRKRIRVPVGVAYGTDIDAFEELVVEVATDESLVLDSPKPRMRLRSFGDSALQYELLCWVSSPSREKKAIHKLNRAIYTALNEADIEIPFPKRDVAITSSGVSVGPAATDAPEPRPESATDGGADAE